MQQDVVSDRVRSCRVGLCDGRKKVPHSDEVGALRWLSAQFFGALELENGKWRTLQNALSTYAP